MLLIYNDRSQVQVYVREDDVDSAIAANSTASRAAFKDYHIAVVANAGASD